MNDLALLALLHLCDSLFPIGGFAHSDGLEAATADGRVATSADLREWMDVVLEEGLGRTEGPAMRLALHAFAGRDAAGFGEASPVEENRFEALRELDAEVYALRPSSAARQASRTMGTRLLKTWLQIRPESSVRECVTAGVSQLTFPVAFGVVAQSAGIDERSALQGFFYVRLASSVSCAMRLMAIGQHEAHTMLASLLTRVPLVVDGVVERGPVDAAPRSFMPAMDLAAMSHQYVHSRLFRS